MRLCSGIGIRLELAQGSARFTCLDLVLGIGSGLGSAWKPGLVRGSGLCSSLGAQDSDSYQSLAWLISVLKTLNSINETTHEHRKCRIKRGRRASAFVHLDEKTWTKQYHEKIPITELPEVHTITPFSYHWWIFSVKVVGTKWHTDWMFC